MKALWLSTLLLLATPALAGDADVDKVNGSIRVDSGESAGNLSTVNGSIRVGDKATVASIDTVNGSITLGDDATATAIDNVNGSISLGSRAKVAGAVENVNGRIRLEAAHVGGGIRTTTGDIEVGANSRVENGIRVDKSHNFSLFTFGKPDVPRIVIGPGAVVQGTLKFDREVELYVSDKATIGPVVGAKPVKFSGAEPPG